MSNVTERLKTLHDLRWSIRPAAVPLLLSIMVVTGCGATSRAASDGDPAASSSALPAPAEAARAFLSHYVDSDGRVVRHDQGSDTVSEGQGYALLLSVAIGDRHTFATVWHWTQSNLQRPSGAFAYHWAGGHVVDTTPATDADLQTAWALSIAATRFHDPAYAQAAKRISAAILSEDVGYDDHGKPTLSAGPWAIASDRPTTVEPGYWTPPAEQALAALTGDKRWQDLPAADLDHLKALSHNGSTLPPDWAEVGAEQPPHATSGPASAPVQSGPDGMRALVWADCTSGGRGLDAKWWHLESGDATAAPLTRTLAGSPTSSDVAALSAVAAAATAQAAGLPAQRDLLLERATAIEQQYPTYYGSAWVALGQILLRTEDLASC